MRAGRQSQWGRLGNSLINIGVIAGTTFADNFLGTLDGLIEMTGQLINNIQEDDPEVSWYDDLGRAFVEN